jgi:alpha-D-ribose 1-methylphosphonate 5-triphosphate diphosphatase
MTEIILTNANLILENEVVRGTIVIRDGVIASVDGGLSSLPSAEDVEGDYVAPGIIEMHTDNMEKHFVPRPGAYWPNHLAAAIANDAQMAAAGITTVYDSICCGFNSGKKDFRSVILPQMVAALEHGMECGAFRVEHYLHLRCEIPSDLIVNEIEPFLDRPILRLASLMDHTPGQRQWRNIELLKTYNIGTGEQTEREFEVEVAERMATGAELFARNWPLVVQMLRDRSIPLATHDDTTTQDVDLGVAAGVMISEFPTTMEAASYARACGMQTVAGAPNIVRGGSNSGGVSAAELTMNGHLDGLSSDYVPSSLLQAVMRLHFDYGLALPRAMAMVTSNMADMLGLADRGRLQPGLRADILRIGMIGETPLTRMLWCAGQRAY